MSKFIHIIPMTDAQCMLVVQALQTAPGLNSYDKLLANNMVEGILGIVSADKQEVENCETCLLGAGEECDILAPSKNCKYWQSKEVKGEEE